MPYVLKNSKEQYVSDIYEAITDEREFTFNIYDAFVFNSWLQANNFWRTYRRNLKDFSPVFTVKRSQVINGKMRRLSDFTLETLI